jgi:glyoxylase-like metal-dependent hydrolase (beta-lactamase superfamily II)
MVVEIIPIALGFDICYVLKADGVVAIDAGAPNKAGKFLSGLRRAGVRPDALDLIVLTHGHWDHAGSAGDMKTATGARIAMHESEVPWLEQSLLPKLPGGMTLWGSILSSLLGLITPLLKIPPAEVDVVLTNGGLSLAEFGIAGRVMYTPGHSRGSVSVLLDSGEAFVGDLAMNAFPLRLTPGLPIIAEDPAAVISSWRLLLEAGARRIYPAHGKPFPANVIRSAISS